MTDQLDLFPKRVRLRTCRHIDGDLGNPTVPEVVDGSVVSEHGNSLEVLFDGETAMGFHTGCQLLVRREDVEEIPANYWRISLSPAYRGATQEMLDELLAECRWNEALR